MAAEQIDQAKKVKRKHEPHWLEIPGVESVGIGLTPDGGAGIRVGVSGNEREIRKQIPENIDGVSIKIFFCGSIEVC